MRFNTTPTPTPNCTHPSHVLILIGTMCVTKLFTNNSIKRWCLKPESHHQHSHSPMAKTTTMRSASASASHHLLAPRMQCNLSYILSFSPLRSTILSHNVFLCPRVTQSITEEAYHPGRPYASFPVRPIRARFPRISPSSAQRTTSSVSILLV